MNKKESEKTMSTTVISQQKDTWPDNGLEVALRLLKSRGQDKLIMIDIGAHHGESLSSVSKYFSGALKYIGLEPNPEAFQEFQSFSNTLRTNDREITCLNTAAGQKNGVAKLLVTKESAVAGILLAVKGLFDRVPSGDHQVISEIEVEMVSVQSLASRYDIRNVDLLKIDTEGYDLEVMRGARFLLELQVVSAVLSEVFFVPYRIGQAYFWDIASFMNDRGYHFVNLYDTRNTSQGRLYTGNALWVSSKIAKANDFL
jgi:FkbM family methyltransferase